MLHQKLPKFPVGSLIVKEKLAEPESMKPELLTVMHKRKKGYDTLGGDWEYLVYDGSGVSIQAHGRLKECHSCHKQWAKTGDYISRDYFTPTMKDKLH